MIVFYLLLFFPILIQHTYIPGIEYQRKNVAAMRLFFIMLLILVACRHWNVGTDTSNYVILCREIVNTPLKQYTGFATEQGFVWLTKLSYMIFDHDQFCLALTAAISILLIARTYIRLCKDTSLTITLFSAMSVFVMLFSGIRQSLAMGIGMLSYEFVRKKKKAWFLFTVVVACLFHNSAIMLLLLYPAYHVKITKKSLYIVVPVILLIFVFNRPIFSFLTVILARFTRFDMLSSATGAYTMLILFVVLAVFAYIIPNEERLDEEAKGLRNILLLAIVVQMFAPLHTLAMRMNYYYIVLLPLLIPMVISARKDSLRQVAYAGRCVMIGVFLLYFFAVLAPSGALDVFPYHFFWESVV